MIGVCAWAALLGVIGLGVAARAMLALITGSPPDWYQPTILTAGVSGIGLTAAAFLSIHNARLPWACLTAATVPLVINVAGTVIAL